MLTLIRIATKISLITVVLGIVAIAVVHAADDLGERLARIGLGTQMSAVNVVMGRPADAIEMTAVLGVTRTKQRWQESGNRAVVVYAINDFVVMTRSCVGSMPDC